MTSRFQYQPRNEDQWKKRGEQSAGKYASFVKDEFRTYSPKKGENWIRILPPTWENPSHYGHDVWVHYSVGPENGTVLCLQKMKSMPCPICEARVRAEAAGREDADKFKPTRRVVAWIIDQKEQDFAKSVVLWAMPWTVDRDISKLCKDRQTGELYQIDHPEAGYDLTFEREGEQQLTKYVGLQLARRSTPVVEKSLEIVIANPIPSTLLWRTYEEVDIMFSGEGEAPQKQEASQPATKEDLFTTKPGVVDMVSKPTAPPPAQTQQAPSTPPPPPVKKAFVSEWTNTSCECGKMQYTTSETTMTCEAGHNKTIATPTNGQAAPPPPVATVAERAADTSTRANSLRERFRTGGQ